MPVMSGGVMVVVMNGMEGTNEEKKGPERGGGGGVALCIHLIIFPGPLISAIIRSNLDRNGSQGCQ